jgi:hypothetical protein|tara:strand:+ start:1864 stop:2697 length:834 start_codon:yes stop_codon:yes gene_type:complete
MHNQTIIFHHIPKTAGLTLNTIIERQYSKNETFSTLGWDGGRKEAIDYFKNLSKDEKNKYRLIAGHSALDLFNFVESPFVLIMLRNPIDRVISLYSYVKRNSWHEFHKVTNEYSLSECFENNIHHEWDELSNGQASSLISSIRKISIYKDKNDVIDIDNVKTFFIHYCLLGIVEQFDDSLVMFRDHLSWKKHSFYYKVNVSKRKPFINDDQRDIILKHNQKDDILYKFACEQFERLITEKGKNFKNKVQSFKSINSLVMPIMNLNNQLRYYFLRIFS